MEDYINIGCVPLYEECTPLGRPGYTEQAKLECNLLKEVILKKMGPPPMGARLVVKGFDHDFGRYYELVCAYNDAYSDAVDYAMRCETQTPAEWPEDIKKMMEEGKSLGDCLAYMKNGGSKKTYGLKDLLESYGMDFEEIGMECLGGLCPAICTVCGYTKELEPDQDRGWCEACEQNTMKSAMVLMGVI